MRLGSGRREGSVLWGLILPIFILTIMALSSDLVGVRTMSSSVVGHTGVTAPTKANPANGPVSATPSASGPGYVKWTLCLDNNNLLNGNAGTCPNSMRLFPYGAAFDFADGDIYVTNDGASNVSVVSGSTNKVVTTIPVGSNPIGAAFDSTNGDIYVTTYNRTTGWGSVSVVSGSTNKVFATIPVGNQPAGAVFDSANGDIYVTNTGSGNVSAISGNTNAVTSSPRLKPGASRFNGDGIPLPPRRLCPSPIQYVHCRVHVPVHHRPTGA